MNASGSDLIMKSIDLSFERRKLALAISGVAAMLVASGLFIWLGVQLARTGGVLATIFVLIGLLVGIAVNAIFAGAITRLSYGELIGRPLQSAKAALLDAVQHLPALFLAPLLLLLGLGAVVLLEALLLLLGRIPLLGELLVAIVFVPLVLFNAFLFVAFAASSWLIYPVVFAENAGVLQAIRRAVELTLRASGRILVYLVLVTFLAVFIVVGVGLLISAAYSWTVPIIVSGMSPERALQMGMSSVLGLLGPLSGGLLYELRGVDIPVTMQIANLLIVLETLVLWLGVLFAIPRVFSLTAGCGVYLSVAGQAPAPLPGFAPQPSAAWQPAPGYVPATPAAEASGAPQPAPSYPPQPARPAYVPTQPMPGASPQQAGWPQAGVVPPSPRTCVNCGKPLANPASRFCQSCGAKQPV